MSIAFNRPDALLPLCNNGAGTKLRNKSAAAARSDARQPRGSPALSSMLVMWNSDPDGAAAGAAIV